MGIRHLRLHHFPASRSARVKWALHETAGDDFEVQNVALYDGQQYSAEYLELNPNHAVPVLEVTWDTGDVQRVLESVAIVTFLADAFPDKGVAPPPGASRARADYLQMLQFGGTCMDMMLWQVRIHEHVLAPAARDPRTIERYRRKFVGEAEPQLRPRLDKHAFICGDAFTAADCVVGHSVMRARRYGLCQDATYRDYLSRLSKRPAFAKAFSDAHLFTPEVPTEKVLTGRFTG